MKPMCQASPEPRQDTTRPRSAPLVPLSRSVRCPRLLAAKPLIQRPPAAAAWDLTASLQADSRQPGPGRWPSSPDAEPCHLRHQPPAADPKLGPHPLDRPALLDIAGL